MRLQFELDNVDFRAEYETESGQLTVTCESLGVTETADMHCATIPQIELFSKMLAMGILERNNAGEGEGQSCLN